MDGLLGAVLAGESDSARQLLRYADDPTALTEQERAAMVSALAQSPELADQLRVLNEFDLEAAIAESDSGNRGGGRIGGGSIHLVDLGDGKPTGAEGSSVSPRGDGSASARWSRASWVRSPLVTGAALLAAAGLAGLLFFVAPARLLDRTGAAGGMDERIARLEGLLAAERDRSSALAAALQRVEPGSVTSPKNPQVAELEAKLRERDQKIADLTAQEAAARSALADSTRLVEERASTIRRLEERLSGPTSSTQLADAGGTATEDGPSARARSPITETAPVPPSSTPIARVDDAAMELREPILIASNSDFVVPNPGDPSSRVVLRSAPSESLPRLTAWVPAQAGWTAKSQPNLYVHFSSRTDLPVQLTIARGTRIVAERRIPSPVPAGVLRIALADLGVTLDSDVVYQWVIAVQPDPRDRARDVMTGGSLKRVATPPSVSAARLIGDPRRVLTEMERAGLWYDALDLLSDWIDRHPSSENLLAHRRSLLASVGIDSSN